MFARALRAPLIVATAYPLDLSIDSPYPEYARALEHAADRSAGRVAAAVAEPGIEVRTLPVQTGGSPARALHELAERDRAQLLVIGSSPRGPVGRVLPTAVTDRLLHGAPCPVAVTPAGYSVEQAEALRLVGVGVTDTPDGRAALQFAGAIAHAGGALVRVFSVEEPPGPFVAVAVDAVALDSMRLAREEAAKTALDRAVEALPRDRCAGGELLAGDPAEALAAASTSLDLLVCGSRGHGPLRTLVLGGTSHALVRAASCPVLVVPPGSPPLEGGESYAVAATDEATP